MVIEDIKNRSKNELISIAMQQNEQILHLAAMLKRTEAQRDALAEECRNLRATVEERQIKIDSCGSIAEAALELQGLMQSAQSAADVYLDNIKRVNEETARRCALLEKESEDKANETVCAASDKSVIIISEAEERAEEIMKTASANANEIIAQAEKLLAAAKTDSEEIRQAAVRFFIDKDNEKRE